MPKLESNLKKFFWYSLTHRRNFLPLLSIYYLTLPSASAREIGFYTGLGSLFAFFLEIPTGYFSDRFGHKKTLVLAKILMFASTLCIVIGDSFLYFALASILISVSFSLTSGTSEVFIHETLQVLKRSNEYVKIMSKRAANVSLISALMIFALPFFSQVNIILPFQIMLIVDLAGIFVSLTLVQPVFRNKIEKNPVKIREFLRHARGTTLFPLLIFTGAIAGFHSGDPFRSPYVLSLGFPLILIGLPMAASRVVWFFVGHAAHKLKERLSIEKLFIFEAIFFSGVLILAAFIKNPYVVVAIFTISLGYMWGRKSVITDYLLSNYSVGSQKATMISIAEQIHSLFDVGIVFSIGFVMAKSYSLGYLVQGIVLLIILIIALTMFSSARKVNQD